MRMRTADADADGGRRTANNYKIRKIRKDEFSAPLIYVQLRATYIRAGLVLIQK